jgi:hypothetical protein
MAGSDLEPALLGNINESGHRDSTSGTANAPGGALYLQRFARMHAI